MCGTRGLSVLREYVELGRMIVLSKCGTRGLSVLSKCVALGG